MLTELNDFDLLKEYDSARNNMSYYNACESGWSSEAEGRNKASVYLGKVREEVNLRKLTPNSGSFLC